MKRHKALSLLSSDHHHGLRFAKKLRSANDDTDSAVKKIFNEFTTFYKSQLLNHFEEEEKYLAPALENNPLILKMFNDHKKMNEMFGSLSKSSNLKVELYSFGKFLEGHIRFEERELFPMIENTLSDDMLQEIGRQIEKRKRS